MLIRENLPERAQVRELGVHRLRDLTQPERIFQISAPDLPSTFAPLASLNVRLPDIIEDANRKQTITQDKIAAERAQVAELEKQLEAHRRQIAALEADLKETTTVRDRLQLAEKVAERHTPPLFITGAASPAATLLGRPLDKADATTSSKD